MKSLGRGTVTRGKASARDEDQTQGQSRSCSSQPGCWAAHHGCWEGCCVALSLLFMNLTRNRVLLVWAGVRVKGQGVGRVSIRDYS